MPTAIFRLLGYSCELTLVDRRGSAERPERNAQKLEIASYAACAHKRAAITANP